MPASLKSDGHWRYWPDQPGQPDIQKLMLHLLRLSCFTVLLLLLLTSPLLQATEVSINSVDSSVENEILVVNADINFDLGDEVVEALENGITLSFYIEIYIYRPRAFIWDEELTHTTKNLQLSYHSLSAQYLLTDMVTSDQQSFSSLHDALLVLGEINELPVIEAKYIDPEKPAIGSIETGIDIEDLPAVMRLQAWLSSEWRSSSGDFEWEIYP